MLRRTCPSLSRARASRSGEKDGYTLVRTGIFGVEPSVESRGEEESKQPRAERAEQSDGTQKRPQHACGTRYNACIRLQKAPIDAAQKRERCSWSVYVRGLDPDNRIGRQKAALDAHHVRPLANAARAPPLRISCPLPPSKMPRCDHLLIATAHPPPPADNAGLCSPAGERRGCRNEQVSAGSPRNPGWMARN